ncbi:hypothetical protein B7463_g1031, partial [Scytalidium lignicola]
MGYIKTIQPCQPPRPPSRHAQDTPGKSSTSQAYHSLQPSLHGSNSEDFQNYQSDYYALDFDYARGQVISTFATAPGYNVATNDFELFDLDASANDPWLPEMVTANSSLDFSFHNTCSPDFASPAYNNISSSLSLTAEGVDCAPHPTNTPNYQSLNNLDQVSVSCSADNITTTSSNPSPTMSKQSSSSSITKPSRGGARKKASTSLNASAIEKRRSNTLAARRYRQKRLDHVEELEAALAATINERDELKVRVARLEGELGGLKELLKTGVRS